MKNNKKFDQTTTAGHWFLEQPTPNKTKDPQVCRDLEPADAEGLFTDLFTNRNSIWITTMLPRKNDAHFSRPRKGNILLDFSFFFF